MNSSVTTDVRLLSASHPHITKHTSVLSIVISSCFALAGAAVILVALRLDRSSSTLCMSLLTVGTILLLVALYRFFWKSKEVVYLPTGSTVKEGCCYLDVGDLQRMNDLLEEGGFETPRNVPVKMSGNARLDYMVSRDGKFAAVQLYRFIPYTYEPFSRVYYYTEADAASFNRRLNTGNF
ncbi:MAG: hypothetical protein IJ456_05990 [Bacteroides sp.]|nr:hypothetical protein [Bacteroides sp.]